MSKMIMRRRNIRSRYSRLRRRFSCKFRIRSKKIQRMLRTRFIRMRRSRIHFSYTKT